jgi:hypothetical protein
VSGGVFSVDEGKVLELLRLAWDGAYGEFSVEHRDDYLATWKAVSMDGERREFTGSGPDELNVELRADWAGWALR